ncbi:hypothetical protein JNUCC42_03415 [Brevibacterium sp. JNUCC-42]|nr:hypothetical protein JNUCC42_03415 [Brevibacterium sp. JNUCC-42]
MDIKEYSKIILERLDSMDDEEFKQLLLDAGIERCPYEEAERSTLDFEQFNINAYTYDNKNYSYSVDCDSKISTGVSYSAVSEQAVSFTYNSKNYIYKNTYSSFTNISEVA